MIFPSHCRFVGVIEKHKGKDYKPSDILYFSSQYMLIFESPEKCDVYEVKSAGEGQFLKEKTGSSLIARSDSVYVYRDIVDISNRGDLIRKAVTCCKDGIDTVVFKGVDMHMTFVHKPSQDTLTVVEVHDVMPPEPAWLAYNVKRLEEAGLFGELMLTFDYRVLDLKDFEDPSRTTIFPCRATGLNGLFLDTMYTEPQGDIKLVGCNTSKLVFEARYRGKKYEFVNTCPLNRQKPQRPFILRCCQSDRLGLKEIDGVQGVAVHWGANPREIYEAVKLLAATIKK